jgi:5-methylcytosine-specific restriction endonuclease McrA
MKKILKTFHLRIVSGSVLFSKPGPSLFRDGSRRNTRRAQRVLQELCGGVKPLSAFYKHPGMADGHPNSCKDCRRAYQRSRSYDKERERQRNQTEARKKYRAANLKRWRTANRAMAIAQRNRNRTLRLNFGGNYTAEEFRALCEKRDNVCLRCRRWDAPLTLDHVVPLSLEGSN